MTLRGAISLLAAVVVAAPAVAQTPSAPAKVEPKLLTQTEVSQALARCALRQNRSAAQRFVEEDWTRAEAKSKGKALDAALVICMGQLQYAVLNSVAMRGAIAEGLLAERDAALLATAEAAAPIAPARVAVPEADRPLRTLSAAVIQCAVAAQPATAAKMLRETAESPGEIAQFRALAPALQACAPENVAVSLKPFTVRPLVAVSVYRRAVDVSAAQDPITGRNDA